MVLKAKVLIGNYIIDHEQRLNDELKDIKESRLVAIKFNANKDILIVYNEDAKVIA